MVIFGAFIFFIVLLVVGCVGGLIYLLYLPLKIKLVRTGSLAKYRSKQINVAYIVIVVGISAYLTFDAFFPGTGFYEAEFKTVTLRDIPKSAEFIVKTSTYPDFHGDYCSSSQIKLSKAEYEKLLSELKSDKRFHQGGQTIGSAEFDKSLGDKDSKKILLNFTRSVEGEDDHYLSISFYDDNKTVFVSICVT